MHPVTGTVALGISIGAAVMTGQPCHAADAIRHCNCCAVGEKCRCSRLQVTNAASLCLTYMAVKGNNVDIVLVLLKPDSSIVYIEENKGNTPLHIATRKGRPDVSEVFCYTSFIEINNLCCL
ncbi:hypothetical protein HPP92_025655 [Vanilla planifolia]|uniref:Uncharacterized protein n=1 Tax=Vanilla planifolia TaxID=51239 RepID=A0A835PFS7_VANPL|nr:hypothetical protein HPP92_025655 [Vanilla planifolia]